MRGNYFGGSPNSRPLPSSLGTCLALTFAFRDPSVSPD